MRLEKTTTTVRKKKSIGGPYPAIPPRGINLHVPRVISEEPLTTTVAAIALHLQSSHHPPLPYTSSSSKSHTSKQPCPHSPKRLTDLPHSSQLPTNRSRIHLKKYFPGAVRPRLPTWHAVWDLEGAARGRIRGERRHLPLPPPGLNIYQQARVSESD
jgi:hypothetical protein